jgi:transcriptional regulator with XRE-family HTH domain
MKDDRAKTKCAQVPEAHPLASYYPAMPDEDFGSLKESIRLQGLLDPITLYEDRVLDGRHRLRACLELGIQPRHENYEGDDPLGFVIAKHSRRNLSTGQKAVIAHRMATLDRGQSKDQMPEFRHLTQDEAASLLGVSRDSVQKARRCEKELGPEELDRRLAEGESLNAIYREFFMVTFPDLVPDDNVIGTDAEYEAKAKRWAELDKWRKENPEAYNEMRKRKRQMKQNSDPLDMTPQEKVLAHLNLARIGARACDDWDDAQRDEISRMLAELMDIANAADEKAAERTLQ